MLKVTRQFSSSRPTKHRRCEHEILAFDAASTSLARDATSSFRPKYSAMEFSRVQSLCCVALRERATAEWRQRAVCCIGARHTP